MSFILQYIIRLSLSLAVIYLFYRFILRPLTFYSWNRWYLFGYSLAAFVIPFININPFLSSVAPGQANVINMIPVIDRRVIESTSWFRIHDSASWILVAIISGVLIMLVRFVIQFISYRKLRRSAILLSDAPVKIFQVNKSIVPFSFGNAIFINREQHGEAEMQEIIRHEFIHIRQKHSADMMFAEILCILNWYNPFAWLIRKVICQNLEFIADQQVLRFGLDKKEYQYLLLKVAGGASFSLTNQFNFSFLHKRIAMMNKMHSARVHLVKFLFVLPLLAVLLLSFREKIEVMLQVSADEGAQSNFNNAETTRQLFDLQLNDTVPTGSRGDTLQTIRLKTAISWKDSSTILLSKNQKQPLFIVDEIVQEYGFVEKLDPNSISRVEVLKDKQALQYGAAGKHGVVRIYMKPVKHISSPKNQVLQVTVSSGNQLKLRNMADTSSIEADSIIILNNHSEYMETTPKSEVMIIVDGVKYAKGVGLNTINPNTIESISVLKDASAVSLYGPDASNGVLIITTRQQPAQQGAHKGEGVIRRIQIKPRDTVSVKPR